MSANIDSQGSALGMVLSKIWCPRRYSTSFGTFDLLLGILCTCTSYLCCIRMHEPVVVSMRRPRSSVKNLHVVGWHLSASRWLNLKNTCTWLTCDQNWNFGQWRLDVHPRRRAGLNQAQFRYSGRLHLPATPINGCEVVQSSLQSWGQRKKSQKNLRHPC